MTIGDVLGVIAALSLLGASWGATLLLSALAFSRRTERAQQWLESAPGPCLLRGLGVLLVSGTVALILAQSHAGPVRILAGALAVGLVALAALGGGGIVRLLGERIEHVGAPLLPFAARTRATVLFVTAGFLPVVGWFLILPASLLLALGAGLLVLRSPRAQPDPTQTAAEVPGLEPLA